MGDRGIGALLPTYVIAEIGVNHDGDPATARALVAAAAAAGADAAKFQLRDMGALYRTVAAGRDAEDLGTQYTLDLLDRVQLPVEDMLAAFDHAATLGIQPLCTPWDWPSAQVLDAYGMPAFKVASADLTNHELLGQLASLGRPLLVSTGMSTEEEIRESVAVLREAEAAYVLLHCNSAYPAPYRDLNLRYLERLSRIGDCVVGYSGHERGFHVPVAAVAMGARVVEKHITLDRTREGNDHKVSLEPAEFAAMVRAIREVEEALGTQKPRRVTQGEMLNRLSLAKSLVAARTLPRGHVVAPADVLVRSPGRGLQPNRRAELIGRRLDREVASGEFFYPGDVEDDAAGPRAFRFARPWGLPVRYHDFAALLAASNPDFLEFHLSYGDLDVDPDAAVPGVLDLGLVVHSPDLFPGDHVLDLASDDDAVRERSILELQRVIGVTRRLAPRFARAGRPFVVVSVGGSSLHAALPVSERPRLYARAAQALDRLDTDGVEVIAQTLPPFPWYLGGQRHCNLFVDPWETAEFARTSGYRLCLDVAHTRLACTHAGVSFQEAVEVLAPHTAHLHLVDAAGVDREGLQVGEGDVDWPVLTDQLDRLAPAASFIPEIWQGHAGGGAGFWVALERLERVEARGVPGQPSAQ